MSSDINFKLTHYPKVDDDEGGFYAGENTQHCVGYIIMQLKQGETEWPGMGNDEDLSERLCDQVDWRAPVFETTEEFFEANQSEA